MKERYYTDQYNWEYASETVVFMVWKLIQKCSWNMKILLNIVYYLNPEKYMPNVYNITKFHHETFFMIRTIS